MPSERLKKIAVLVLCITLVLPSLGGCKSKKVATANLIRYDIGSEPKTLDPTLNSAVESGTIIVNAFEGLTRFGEGDKPVAGVAETWDVSEDGLTYTFHLRDNAKWSDGKPVTAKDFEYSWKRGINPETAAEYANYFYYIKNAEGYNTGKGSANDVGVKATDDKTLVVTLENVTPYFLQLTAFPTYAPLRQDIIEANKDAWATKPATLISNGPFKLTEWRPKDKIILEKNENYWNESAIKLERIEFSMIEEPTSRLAAYRSGQLDYIEGPPPAEVPGLLQSGEAAALPYLGTYFFSINVTPKAASVDAAAAKALSDVRVRKALILAIDREAITKNVLKGGQVPAGGFVPPGVPSTSGGDFTTKNYFEPKGNVDEAKKLLSDAGYPNGQGFPKVTLLYNTGGSHQDVAQAVQDMWRKNLNINVELANQEWKVFQVTRTNKDYLIARDGWIGDYMDPMTFLELFTSASGNNNPGYKSADYDVKITAAKKETDPAKRDQALRDAETILMNDAPIIPIYYYVNIALIKDYVKGTRKSQLGYVFFENAYVQK